MGVYDNVSQAASAGFDMMQLWRKDSNGVGAGITGSVASGSVASMKQLVGVKSANIQVPADNTVQSTGDDGIIASFQFESNAVRAFDIQSATQDLDIASAAQGTSIYAFGDGANNAAYYNMMPGDVIGRDYTDMEGLFSIAARGTASGKTGLGFWHFYYPQFNLTYLGANLNEQTETPFNYSSIVNPVTELNTGQLLEDLFGKAKAHFITWYSRYRYTFNTYRYNGSDTSFQVSRVPYTDANGAIRAYVFKQSTGQNLTGQCVITPATRTIDISGVTGISAGDYLTVHLEYA